VASATAAADATVTETVYRHQLRPVLLTGAVAMDRIFVDDEPTA
jgi:hypothetical protein